MRMSLGMPESDLGQNLLQVFHSKRRLDEIYPDGETPPDQPSKPSDLSATSGRSNHQYGMNLVKEKPSAFLLEEQHPSVHSHIGSGFSSYIGPSSIEAELQMQLDGEDNKVKTMPANSMVNEIHKAMLSTKNGSSGPWLPYSALKVFSSRDRVDAALRQSQHFSESELTSLTDYICGVETGPHRGGNGSRRIFVILVLIRTLEILPSLMKNGLRDKDLPFEWLDPASATELISPKSQFARKPLPCFEEPGIAAARDFYKSQWMILTPLISLDEHEEVTTFHLDEKVIMPWTSIGEVRKNGGYSTVRKVEIHEDHHTFHAHKAFALKTLIEHDDAVQAQAEFEQELKAFNKMEPGNHILKLCATFKIGKEYSFLSPWAEGGNLEQLWENCPTKVQKGKPEVQKLLRWIAEQCHAVAEALQSIHEVRVKALIKAKRLPAGGGTDSDIYGIHGDIKPENILLFDYHDKSQGMGILKIADFGLTDFHRLQSRTRPLNQLPNNKHAAPTYSAPELVHPQGFNSRKADIWSLGCVFSEFLTWVVRGKEAVAEYGDCRFDEADLNTVSGEPRWKEDKFFCAEFGENGEIRTSLKKSVVKWFGDLCEESKTDEPNFITDFLGFLEAKVLVCDRQKRIGCDDLVARLKIFADRARLIRENDPYWGPPLPTFANLPPTNVPEISITHHARVGV